MGKRLDFARRLRDDQTGATVVEYTLMIVFVAAACFVSVATLGTSLSGLIQRAVNGLQ